MGRFRKRPVTIEAVLFTGGEKEAIFSEHPDWLLDALGRAHTERGAVWFEAGWAPPVLMVHTLNGPVHAAPGEWIVRTVKGDLYPCDHDVFTEHHEKVEG